LATGRATALQERNVELIEEAVCPDPAPITDSSATLFKKGFDDEPNRDRRLLLVLSAQFLTSADQVLH
jgi:hypothetical protein